MTSYERVTIGDVDYEDPFAGIATIRAYETDSEGNPSMLKQFYETQKDVMDGAQKRYTFVALDGTGTDLYRVRNDSFRCEDSTVSG